MKVFRILFYVNRKRDEVLVDKRRDFRVLVRLGFQPSAGTSGRRRGEIYEQRLLLFFSSRKRLVGVFDPIDGHK
jgi:hypothetical protein